MSTIYTPRFHPRATINGRVDWVCAFDGRTQVSYVDPFRPLVACAPGGKYLDDSGTAHECASVFALGLRFAPVPRSAHRKGKVIPVPADWSAPDGLIDAFPTGDLFRWQAQYPVHVLAGADVIDRSLLTTTDDSLSTVTAFIQRVTSRAARYEQRYTPAVSLGRAFAEVVSEVRREAAGDRLEANQMRIARQGTR